MGINSWSFITSIPSACKEGQEPRLHVGISSDSGVLSEKLALEGKEGLEAQTQHTPYPHRFTSFSGGDKRNKISTEKKEFSNSFRWICCSENMLQRKFTLLGKTPLRKGWVSIT